MRSLKSRPYVILIHVYTYITLKYTTTDFVQVVYWCAHYHDYDYISHVHSYTVPCAPIGAVLRHL